MPVGSSPKTADEVNTKVGEICQTFASVRSLVNQQEAWLAATDLKMDPYNMSAFDETEIKSAISTLDTGLQAVDMTFVSRLIGLPTIKVAVF